MEFIRVKNWEKYQHYKDRSAPWIKLYRDMMDSAMWVMGTDASKLLATCTMLLAVRTDNKIPLDLPYILRVCHLEIDPDFSELIKYEFIEIINENGECLQDASKPLAMCTPEKRREREENTSVSREKIAFDGSSFQNLNGHLDAWRKAYPAINVEDEISKAAAWLVSNPKNKKSQYGRFLNGWLSRAQDKAPRVPQEKRDWI